MLIALTVKPKSRRSEVVELEPDSFIVYVKSAPVDGVANKEVVRLLSKFLKVPQRAIRIKRGINGKKKYIEVT